VAVHARLEERQEISQHIEFIATRDTTDAKKKEMSKTDRWMDPRAA